MVGPIHIHALLAREGNRLVAPHRQIDPSTMVRGTATRTQHPPKRVANFLGYGGTGRIMIHYLTAYSTAETLGGGL